MEGHLEVIHKVILEAKRGMVSHPNGVACSCCSITPNPQTSYYTVPRGEFLPLYQLSFQLFIPSTNPFNFTSLHYTSPHYTSSVLVGAGIQDQSASPVGGDLGGLCEE